MNMFMVEAELPYYKDEEFINLIPRQRQMIGRLLQAGVIATFSLNLDRTKMWMVIFAENEDGALQILEKFPMYRFMTIELHGLSVTDRAPAAAPPLVMN